MTSMPRSCSTPPAPMHITVEARLAWALASIVKPSLMPKRRSPAASPPRNSSLMPPGSTPWPPTSLTDVSKNGRESLILRAHYQDKAATLLVEAVKQMPDAERAGFLRNVIEVDQPLRAIRRRIRSQELSSAADSKKPSERAPAQ